MLPGPLAVVPVPAAEPLPVVPEVLPLADGEVLLPEPEVPALPDAPPDVLPGPAVGAMPPGDTVLPAGGQSGELFPDVPPDGALEPEPLVLEPLELCARTTGANPKARPRASVSAMSFFM